MSLCTAICLYLKTVTEIEECVFFFFYTVLVFHLSVVLLKYNW